MRLSSKNATAAAATRIIENVNSVQSYTINEMNRKDTNITFIVETVHVIYTKQLLASTHTWNKHIHHNE